MSLLGRDVFISPTKIIANASHVGNVVFVRHLATGERVQRMMKKTRINTTHTHTHIYVYIIIYGQTSGLEKSTWVKS